MYLDTLGQTEEEKQREAINQIATQVLEQRAWALKQASTSNRAKYVGLSIGTALLAIAVVGGGTYYVGKKKYWW